MAKSLDDHGEVVAANPDYQERPHNGASIGAWIGDRHLPPVSLGGLIMVDDRQYGMTVHHMLDDPDHVQQRDTATKEGMPRSMAGTQRAPDLAAWYAQQYQSSESDPDSSGTEDYACEFSDSDSDTYSESAITSEYSDDEGEEEDQYAEPGDIPGVEPGCGDGYIVTQPALDDVPEGFYPSPETEDEDHLDTYSLGEVYASSGLRRRTVNGLLHEIDWALFEFNQERLPDGNLIPFLGHATAATERRSSASGPTIHPTSVVPSSSLPGLQVQCMARTSGLQSGLILPAIASVKIYGRISPSQIYQVSGTRPQGGGDAGSQPSRALAMGIPGDSGAWVVDRDQGQVCGHILAWSERKRVAYICPMDVLLLDIAETLEANEIRMPGGKIVFSRRAHQLGRTLTQSSMHSTLKLGVEEAAEGVPSVRPTYDMRRLSRGSRQLGHRNLTVDADEDSNGGEAVDMELAREIRELQLSEQGVPVELGRWGVV